MSVTLRPYQAEAVQKIFEHFLVSDESACVVLPTGAGKSLVIAELCRKARGRVLVLAHVKELCRQNFEKYVRLDEASPHRKPAGIYSAGLNQRQTEDPVLFGSIQSVARHPAALGSGFSLVVIDECHRVSGDAQTQYRLVLDHLKSQDRNLKVLGLTATPYRLGLGWTYRQHASGRVTTDEARPFEHCVYEVTLRQMIEAGYLTPATLEDAPVAQYAFEALLDGSAERDRDSVNLLLSKHRRVTQAIVEQIQAVSLREGRKGVMIFAATVEHAKEIASYLPQEQTAIILGETESSERDTTITAFVDSKIRYLVNVSVLTTGFDAPHVDLIAILRKTESVGLFQQIVGRGLRLFPGKKDCKVIDYAGNGFDLFTPEIGEKKPGSDSVPVTVLCPECDFENRFWGRMDDEGRVVEHFGRRCQGRVKDLSERSMRCTFRFRFKECEACGGENDIAARTCEGCEKPLVDPDDTLRDALRLRGTLVLRVSGMSLTSIGTRLRITYHDEDGATVSESFDFNHRGQRTIFNRIFGRRIAQGRRPLELEDPSQAEALRSHLPIPDFVIARKKKKGRTHFFRVTVRLFDYRGSFRTADQSDVAFQA